MMKNRTFIDSIRCAVIGLKAGYQSEKNFKYYSVIGLITLVLNICLNSNLTEYCIFIILTASVFASEYINTAIERISDQIDSQYNEAIRDIKDISAGAVLVFGIAFLLAETLILVSKL